MRVYEYARKRNINSRDVVRKCHELGIMTVKNHLSLIPLKRLNELDQINFEENIPKSIRKSIFVLSFEESNSMVQSKVLRPFKRHKDQIYILQPTVQRNNQEGVDRIFDVLIREQWLKVNVYRQEGKNLVRYYVEIPEALKGHSKERQRLDLMSMCYQVAIALLETIKVDQVVGIDWMSGLFPLTYQKLNPHHNPTFNLHLSTINYEGIYDLKELTLFFLDFREKQQVEYAGSLNFLKAGLLTYDHIHFIDDAEQQLKESYLREFYYDQ